MWSILLYRVQHDQFRFFFFGGDTTNLFINPVFSQSNAVTCLIAWHGSKPTSDHIPCMVQIDIMIPKVMYSDLRIFFGWSTWFLDLVQTTWNSEIRATNSVTRVTAKLKLIRRVLKNWSKGISVHVLIQALHRSSNKRKTMRCQSNKRKIMHCRISNGITSYP